ncbi:hypothetical protein CLOM_g5412 [Closterium sp. NIES-68]|nr:hypothetical protein CLOM_g5412 [Closterium sp. NIES-68]GJP60681.1 hypothetical protein CLOP_g17899 [Closterium sp. NIES-67]
MASIPPSSPPASFRKQQPLPFFRNFFLKSKPYRKCQASTRLNQSWKATKGTTASSVLLRLSFLKNL